MKKLLSVVLALALCLTAMMGCFAVSAETVATSATINIAGGEAIKAGETATVTVTGSDFTDVCAADLVITLPAGFELVSVSEAGEVLVNDENGVYYVYDETANTVKYIDVFNFNDEVKALDLALVVTAPADAEDGEYAVTGAVVAANIDEEFLGVTINNGAITVQNEVLPPEPVLDESITVTFSCGLDATAYISCVTTDSQLTKYADYDVVVTRNTTSGSDYNFKEIVETISDENKIASGGKTYWYYYGIEMFSLMIPVNVVVNCKDADGNVVAYSKTFTTTLKEALATNYSKTSNVKLKKAITDCINAGTEVQKFFTNGKTCDYANLALPNDGWDQTYASTELGTLAAYNTANNGNITVAPGAGVSAAPYISFNMAGVPAAELAQYNIKMSFYDAVYKKTVETTINLADPSVLSAGGKYYAYFYDMTIYSTNAEVVAEIYKDGNDTAISTYSYCFDSFINTNKNHAKMGAAIVALGKLGQSFRAAKGV